MPLKLNQRGGKRKSTEVIWTHAETTKNSKLIFRLIPVLVICSHVSRFIQFSMRRMFLFCQDSASKQLHIRTHTHTHRDTHTGILRVIFKVNHHYFLISINCVAQLYLSSNIHFNRPKWIESNENIYRYIEQEREREEKAVWEKNKMAWWEAGGETVNWWETDKCD